MRRPDVVVANLSRRVLVPVVAVLLLVAGCVALPAMGDDSRTVTVRLRDSAGLFTGNDVGVLGVRVGEVSSITPRGAGVDVVLRITDPDVDIPADAAAVVVSRSVATDRYVELTPVYQGGPKLADRARIGMDRTRTPVEFDELMTSVTEISKALSSTAPSSTGTRDGDGDTKGPLADLLRQSARTLDGQGGTIRDGLGDLADVLGDVDSNLGDVEGTVKNLDTLTKAVADDRVLVKDFTSQVAQATDMLDDQKESIGATFDALSAMVKAVAAFVREHHGRVSNQLDDFVTLARTLNQRQGDLEGLLDDGPLMLQNLVRAIDENDRLSFRTRPVSLVPGALVAMTVCREAKLPEAVCREVSTLPVWKLLEQLAGVRDK